MNNIQTQSLGDIENLLFENFTTLSTAPDGIARLREMILQLAVQGKLRTQDAGDEPANILLEKIRAEKKHLVKGGKIKKENLIQIIKNETPYPVPEGWKWVTLADIFLDIRSGGTPSKNNPQFWNGEICWASVKDLKNGKYLESTQDKITQQGLDECRSKLIPPGNLIICVRMGLGKIAINKIPIAINQDLKAVGLSKKVDINYFYHFYRAQTVRGTGMTVDGIRQEKLLLMPFPLPPLAEQHRIVEKVDRLMALCDELEAKQQQERAGCLKLGKASLAGLQNAESPEEFELLWAQVCDAFDLILDCPENVEVLRQTILQLAVQGRLGTQDPDDEPAEKLVERIIFKKGQTIQNDETPPYNLPKGWIWVKIQAISNLSSGKSFKKSEYTDKGVRLLQITNVKYRRIIWEDLIFLPESYLVDYPELLLNENDILMALNRPLSKGRLKSAKLRSNDVPSILYQRVGRFDLAFDEIRDYFFQYLHSPVFINRIERSMQGSDQPFVNKSHILNAWMPLPPLVEQHRIVAKINCLMELCNKLEASLQKKAVAHEKYGNATIKQVVTCGKRIINQ